VDEIVGRRAQLEVTGASLAAEMTRITRFQAEIKGNLVDDSRLPPWARMTPEEKAKKAKLDALKG
jgi:hypothetical protein